MSKELARLIEIASEISGIPIAKLSEQSAIDQDLRVTGGDVVELVEALADEFGSNVLAWPWQKFAMFSEGLSLLFPFALFWQLLTWPLRGTFGYASELERLELGHIAAVIEKGEWFDP